MEEGVVTGNRVIVTVSILRSNGDIVEIDAVMDTGFSGFLTLAPRAIESLKLEWINRTFVHLAGSQPAEVDVFAATLLWYGREVDVEVLEIDDDPLLGMAQLRGSEVRFSVEEGGLAEIVSL